MIDQSINQSNNIINQSDGSLVRMADIDLETSCTTSQPPGCLLTTGLQSPAGGLEAGQTGFDLEAVDAETCVLFSRAEEGESELRLRCSRRSKLISGLRIVAETRLLEIFSGNQFLDTAVGSLFDDFEGIKVHTFQIKVDPASDYLALRIPGKWETTWIFSINVQLIDKSVLPINGNFDFSNVDKLLSSQKPLSQNAQSFKLLFENFQKVPEQLPKGDYHPGSGGAGPPKFSDILANPLLLASMQKSMQGSMLDAPEIQQLKNRFSAEIHQNNFIPEIPQSRSSAELEPSAAVESMMKLELQSYIDLKFSELEATLVSRIELAERNTNTKLDLILEKLEKI